MPQMGIQSQTVSDDASELCQIKTPLDDSIKKLVQNKGNLLNLKQLDSKLSV